MEIGGKVLDCSTGWWAKQLWWLLEQVHTSRSSTDTANRMPFLQSLYSICQALYKESAKYAASTFIGLPNLVPSFFTSATATCTTQTTLSWLHLKGTWCCWAICAIVRRSKNMWALKQNTEVAVVLSEEETYEDLVWTRKFVQGLQSKLILWICYSPKSVAMCSGQKISDDFEMCFYFTLTIRRCRCKLNLPKLLNSAKPWKLSTGFSNPSCPGHSNLQKIQSNWNAWDLKDTQIRFGKVIRTYRIAIIPLLNALCCRIWASSCWNVLQESCYLRILWFSDQWVILYQSLL